MRFAFTSDQILFRDAVKDLLDKRCPPGAVRAAWADPSGRVPGLWAALAEMGITGLTVPEDLGGLGLGELDLVLLLEEAGRAALPDPLLETTAVGVPLLREIAPASMAAEWLPKVAAGEAVIATRLDPAPYAAFANTADLLLITDRGEIHAVPRAEVELTAQPSVDGSRRLFSVRFQPSAATRLAEGEAARRAAANAFDRGALAAAAELVGIARRMLEKTVEYVQVRHQFGKPIGSFQAIKHHLANALIQIEFARPVVYRAAHSIVHAVPQRSLHVSMAKAQASDAARGAARAALQCHGAIGYTEEFDLHLWMKRAWALAAAWGDAAWHRARAGEVILDGERIAGGF